MDPEAARIEHLKLIQEIIARMGRNSFAIKAGAVTMFLITLLIATSERDIGPVALRTFTSYVERLIQLKLLRSEPKPENGTARVFYFISIPDKS